MDKDLFGNEVLVAPTVYVKAATTKTDDGFMLCSSGKSAIDNNDWVVTTHHLKYDEVPDELADAKTFSELVSFLINKHYNRDLDREDILELTKFINTNLSNKIKFNSGESPVKMAIRLLRECYNK
jgi:hypothetical protein